MANKDLNGIKLLNYWNPPDNAGEPIGCIATSFTFNSEFFEEDCLSRFLQMDTDPKEDGPLYLIEREEKMAQLELMSVIVDEVNCRGKRSLRWDLISFRNIHLLHSKIVVLVWSGHIRIVIGSNNLTPDGYRYNREVAGVFDFSENDGIDLKALEITLESLNTLLSSLDSKNPAVNRALKFIKRIPEFATKWKRIKYTEGIERKILNTGIGEKNLLSKLNLEIKRKNTSINDAYVVSPFYVAPEDSNPAVKMLAGLLATENKTSINWYGTTEEVGEEKRIMFVGPESLLLDSKANNVKNVRFYGIPVDELNEKNQLVKRTLHLKSIWLESDEYIFYCIGSSNFTTNGLGISKRPNFESNILYIVDKASNSKAERALRNGFPEANLLGKDIEFMKEFINSDERNQTEVQPLPTFFETAIYKHEVGVYLLELRFKAESPLLYGWKVLDEENKEMYSSNLWDVENQPISVRVEWHQSYIPSELKVVSENKEEYIWSVIAENASALPVPDELGDLPLELLIQLLATNKPLHHALRKWQKKNTNTLDLRVEELINPHDKVDVTGFLLRRTRRISYAFSMMKAQLEKPLYTKATMEWRLKGPLGVMALAKAILKEAKSEEEKVFLLAEMAIELSEVKIAEGSNCVPKRIVLDEIKSLIIEIKEHTKLIENKNSMIREYTKDAFDKALNNV